MKSFHNKTAVITGAGSGIGRELALALADAGCNLALCDFNAAGLDETITMVGDKVHMSRHLVDVSDREQMLALPDDVLATHGQVHLLFNNAGITSAGTFTEQSMAAIERMIDVNVMGVLYGTKAFLPHLQATGEAHIVNISSMVGFIGVPGNTMYSASKFTIRGFSEAMWAELAGTGVGVTVIHPGTIRTNIIRSADVADSGEHEQLIRFMERFGMPPEKAAKKILQAVRKGKIRQAIGLDAHAFRLLERLCPALLHQIFYHAFKRRNQKQ